MAWGARPVLLSVWLAGVFVHAAHWTTLVEQQLQVNPFMDSATQPSQRYSHSAVEYGGEIFISHGYFYNRWSEPSRATYLRDTWSYSMKSNRWTRVNNGKMGHAPNARMSHGAVVHGASMYLFGGERDDSEGALCGSAKDPFCEDSYYNDMWILDLQTHVWSLVPNEQPLPRARSGMVFEALGTGMIMYGGLRRHDTWTYSPQERKWTAIETSEPKGTNHPGDRYGATGATVGRRLYVFGGNCHKCPHSCMNDLWYIDADAPVWHSLSSCTTTSQTPNLFPIGRYYSSMAVWTSQPARMLLHGGCDCTRGNGCQCFDDTWSYDVDTNTWSRIHTIPQLDDKVPTGRYKHSMVKWRNQFVVFGGESYNPYMYYNTLSTLHTDTP